MFKVTSASRSVSRQPIYLTDATLNFSGLQHVTPGLHDLVGDTLGELNLLQGQIQADWEIGEEDFDEEAAYADDLDEEDLDEEDLDEEDLDEEDLDEEGYQYDLYGWQAIYEPGANGLVDFGGDDVITVGGSSAVDNPYPRTKKVKFGGLKVKARSFRWERFGIHFIGTSVSVGGTRRKRKRKNVKVELVAYYFVQDPQWPVPRAKLDFPAQGEKVSKGYKQRTTRHIRQFGIGRKKQLRNIGVIGVALVSVGNQKCQLITQKGRVDESQINPPFPYFSLRKSFQCLKR